ncbi:hypothetical protein AL073_12665 [Loktanella sp. 1ANDIMAR09]|nr:hypothetical protein AL073_12665 [Loktanella sp. 1ANDIMAR09]
MLRINREQFHNLGVEVSPRDELTAPLRSRAIAFVNCGGLMKQARLRFALWRFRRQVMVTKEPVVLISDENLLGTKSETLFASRQQANFEAVARLLDRACSSPHLDCRYVVYVRSREAWRASAYNQSVKKAKHHLDFPSWCAINESLDAPDQIVEALRLVLGDRLDVIAMEDELGSGALLGSAVLSACGLSKEAIAALKTPSRLNVSLPQNAVDLIRVLGQQGLEPKTLKKVADCIKENVHLFDTVAQESSD